MKNDLVSVILPVFNAGQYLNQIFQDILNQTYEAIEIIVIDDGSTDDSWNVIQRFKQRDENILAIHVENGGPSKARNLGLQKANGKYIRFVDADDRLPKDSIEVMIKGMQTDQSIDMVIGNYHCIPEHNYFKGDEFYNTVLGQKEFANLFVKNMKSFYYGVTWNKLYKKEIIEQYHIYFDEKIDWCEDLCFNLDYYAKCHNIYICSLTEGVYIYCPRENSITGSLSKREKEKLREIDEICYEKACTYCGALGLEKTVRLEWKYYNLYYQLSAIVIRKEKHKYVSFKELLSRKDVQEYIYYKQEESKMWKFLKIVIDKKLYSIANILFWIKGFMVSRFGQYVPRLKGWLHKFLPKVL